MPNALTQNPIIITTPMLTSYKSQTNTPGSGGLGAFNYLLVEKIYWMTPVAIGDTAAITDPTTGNILLNLRCEAAGQSQIVDWSAKPRRWSDFITSSVSSGTLYLYLA